MEAGIIVGVLLFIAWMCVFGIDMLWALYLKLARRRDS